MAVWTTSEIRLLKSLHLSGLSRRDLALNFPRHSRDAVNFKMHEIGVMMKGRSDERRMSQARAYFTRRAVEAGS